MTPRTAAFLQAMAKAPLLTHVGKSPPDGVHGERVASWSEALDPERQANWNNVKLDARGDLTSFLAHHHRERNRAWNQITGELRPRVLELCTPICEAAVRTQEHQKSLLAAVSWDLLAAGMEYEYADLRPPGLYDRLVSIYEVGRFPCGWRGDYPEGSLEIL